MTRPRPSRAARNTGDLSFLELLRLSARLNRTFDRKTRAEQYAVHADELHRRLVDPDETHLATVSRIVARFDPVPARRADAKTINGRAEREKEARR